MISSLSNDSTSIKYPPNSLAVQWSRFSCGIRSRGGSSTSAVLVGEAVGSGVFKGGGGRRENVVGHEKKYAVFGIKPT